MKIGIVFSILVLIDPIAAQTGNFVMIATGGNSPAFALDASSNVHIVWRDTGNLGCLYAVFDSTLKPLHSPRRISNSSQVRKPAIAFQSDYGCITWIDNPPISPLNEFPEGQIVNTNGRSFGANFQFISRVRDVDVCGAYDSSFIILWNGGSEGIFGVYSSALRSRYVKKSKFGTDSTLDWIWQNLPMCDTAMPLDLIFSPRIAANAKAGRYAVSWLSSYAYFKYKLWVNSLDLTESPIGKEQLVSDTTTPKDIWYSDIGVTTNGDVIVAWAEDDSSNNIQNICLRLLNPDGTPKSDIRNVNQEKPSYDTEIKVAMGEDDRFIVAWSTGDHYRLIAQRFDRNGDPIGDNFYIADTISRYTGQGSAFAVRNGRIYAAWDINDTIRARVLDFDNPQVSVKTRQIPPSLTFELFQSYPNPFNPATTIRYQTPKDGQVTLIIYDALGRVVRTLLDEYKLSGRYSVDFDGSGLSTGTYFYSIRAGELKSVKKMTLIK